MYYRPQLAQRKPARRTAETQKFSAPSAGWLANQNLDSPATANGAFILDNWFPTATGAIIRNGTDLYATLGDGSLPTTAIFDYDNGANTKLFAATVNTIYDITAAPAAVVTGQTSGDWVTTQYATTGGIYVVAVNGTNTMQIFDGTLWFPIDQDDVYQLHYDTVITPFTAGQTITGATSHATAYVLHVDPTVLYITNKVGTFQDNETITSAGGSAKVDGVAVDYYVGITGVDTSTFAYVWTYKNRLFFIQRESFNVYYLPIDSIGGAATAFPMGGEFPEGGKLIIGSGWSLDNSGDGGLSEQCIFITDEGEVSVYQGLSPDPDQGWTKVGLYKIGKPLGHLAWMRAGGDFIIATDIGYIPLSQAVNRDVAALAPAAVSYPIETAWNEAVAARRLSPWHCVSWPDQQMVVVATPTVDNEDPMCLIANARTGGWARFTGWDINCICVFEGRMFFGSANGRVVEAYVTGMDEGVPFTSSFVPQFIDMGSPSSRKISAIGRAVLRGSTDIAAQITAYNDYNVTFPAPPNAMAVSSASVWGGGVWGVSAWGGKVVKKVQTVWRSVSAAGYALAPGLQITSGSLVALDTEIVRLELIYQTAEVVS